MKCEETLQKIDSYINNTLTYRELEDFLAHIASCPECYDELETYYTISIGMKYLEDETQEFYNIPQMLKTDLKTKQNLVRRHHILNRILIFFVLIIIILSALFALFQWGYIDLPILF